MDKELSAEETAKREFSGLREAIKDQDLATFYIALASVCMEEYSKIKVREELINLRSELEKYSNELDEERRANFSDMYIGNIGIDTVLGIIDNRIKE